MRQFITILSALLLYGCGYNSFGDGYVAPPNIATNATIAQLKALCGQQVVKINKPLVVGGIVTSCDRSGNFFKTLTIEDGGAAIELEAGQYSLYTLYAEGTRVALRVEGLVVAPIRGVVHVGLENNSSSYPVGSFDNIHLLRTHLLGQGMGSRVQPKQVTIGELDESWSARLVRLQGLAKRRVVDQMTIYTDPGGDSIALYVSDYCDFAQQPGPDRLNSLTGIVEIRSSERTPIFSIKPRYESDIVGR